MNCIERDRQRRKKERKKERKVIDDINELEVDKCVCRVEKKVVEGGSKTLLQRFVHSMRLQDDGGHPGSDAEMNR